MSNEPIDLLQENWKVLGEDGRWLGAKDWGWIEGPFDDLMWVPIKDATDEVIGILVTGSNDGELREIAFEQRAHLMAAAPEMLRLMVAQVAAMDTLIAMLIDARVADKPGLNEPIELMTKAHKLVSSLLYRPFTLPPVANSNVSDEAGQEI